MKNQELLGYLEECGVCEICQLRYLKAREDDYAEIKEYFKKLNVGNGTDNNDVEFTVKKPKIGVCSTCLGLFSNEFQQVLLEEILNSDIDKYDCNEIVLSVSLPMIIQIRQLAMWYALIEKFGSTINIENPPDFSIKETLKLLITSTLCERLKKDYECIGNGIIISVTLSHAQDEFELKQLKKLHERIFPTKSKRKQQAVSRGIMVKQYTPKFLKAGLFQEYLIVPPSACSDPLNITSISLTGPTLFIAGRYRKITRNLSHTPWVLNGQRVMENSIEEIITRVVAAYFAKNQTRTIFMSSGREDVDVRCLGKGRPFALEICDCNKITLPSSDAYLLQQKIEESDQVSVCDLQIVQREDLIHIKNGEEQKRKHYRALCVLQQPATVEILEKLNLPEGFTIHQKTPIRVLHRRPLHTRLRTIYSLKTFVDRKNSKILILDIVSQAGTYIKELVHGEFGRTSPSICSIISRNIDIIALDVMGIDMEWPKEINPSPNSIEIKQN